MTDIPIQAKRQIAAQKLLVWRNTHYSAKLDAEIAQSIDDAQMLEQAKANMKRALWVLDELEKILAGIGADGNSSSISK